MLGRIIGNTVTEIVFRCPYGREVTLGEIVVADDMERDIRFFLRVVDLRYGQEGSGQWGLRTAGEMLALDDAAQPYQMRDKERRLFKLAVCAPLGVLRDRCFERPRMLPAHFSPVRRADADDYAFLQRHMGDIEVGCLRSGQQHIDVPVAVQGSLLSHHVGIFATTGMGKSNLMRVFAASVMRQGRYGLLIVDPHGEYYDGGGGSKGLRHHPLAERSLAVYSPHRLSGPHTTLQLAAAEITVGDVQNIFSFSDAQRDALYALKGRYGRRWLLRLADMDIDTLVEAFGQKIHESTFGVLQRRAERILASDIVHTDESVEVTDDVLARLREGTTVLVDTSGLYEYEELLVSVLLARRVLQCYKGLYQDKERFRQLPPVLVTMEEAQRVLRERQGAFARIAREGRKFKVGLCAITQQPRLIQEELLSQFNTFFILGLADESDRNIIKSSAKQDLSKLEKEIQTMEAGEALITYPGAPFAIPAKIHWYDDYLEDIETPLQRTARLDEDFY